MKKRYVLFVLLFIPLFMSYACSNGKSETKVIVYENQEYSFMIELPKTWKGKYEVVETDNNVTFFSKANRSVGGQLFTIGIWSTENWTKEGEELSKMIHISKIGEKGNNVYALSTPTDVQYSTDDEQNKKEYLTMFDDIESIKTTFKTDILK